MVFQLQCAIQKYAWGKCGEESAVAQLVQSSCSHFKIDPNEQYAELWMGTHPSGPAKILGGKGLLKDWIGQNVQSLGSKVHRTFGNDLPFLFKVLSVNKALSIQAHPSKSHAAELHKLFPDKYPDDNHKPEMAIALTPFEAVCGFRPFVEIQNFIKDIPELREMVGHEIADLVLQRSENEASQRELLKKCFTALMTCPQEKFSKLLADFVKRLSDESEGLTLAAKVVRDLVLRVHAQFPGDIGCFGLLFFNYIKLEPGQALFLAANEPHAYLFGDCIECMACSDNVVRAGLTPKFKDIKTLCEMLTYNCKTAADNLFPHETTSDDPYCWIYNPPVQDFAVDRILIPAGSSSYDLQAKDSASILLIIDGEASVSDCPEILCKRGTVLFVPADQSLRFDVKRDGMLMFRAYTPLQL